MTVAATLVMLLNMTWRVPYSAYGAIYAITISREDPYATIKSVKTTIIGFGLSVLYVLIGAMFFLRDPDLRLFWVIVTFFLMFYCLSAAKNYLGAARFGYLLIITIPLWDRQIPAEDKVEGTLWAFAVISLSVLITMAIELAYAQWKHSDFLVPPIVERLAAVEEVLDSLALRRTTDERTASKITQLALAGNSTLRRTLQRSAYSPQYREQMGGLVTLVGRLVDIAANLTHLRFEIPDDGRSRISAIAENVKKVWMDLLARRVPHFDVSSTPDAFSDVPLLAEMDRTVSLIPGIFTGSLSLADYTPLPSDDGSIISVFKADALTNPEHIKFGLKGCLAASLCYLIYNGKAWPEISTAVTTCFLTALSTVGSSRQKQILRICGAIAGGLVMGMGAEVFVLPYLDSITGFTLLFVTATIVAAWLATASPRLSYFGVQTAVAFYLINLGEFKVRTSLEPARDRVIGIFLGLIIMWIVFDQLWGAPAVVEMKKAFTSNLRLLAQFAREPSSADLRVAIEKNYALRETINTNLDNVRALGDAVLLEFGPSRDQDLAFRDCLREWQVLVRTLFLTQIATWKYRAQLPGFELPDSVASAQRDFDEHLAKTLEAMAAHMEGSSLPAEPLGKSIAPLEQVLQESNKADPQNSPARFQALLALYRRIEELMVPLQQQIAAYDPSASVPVHAGACVALSNQ
ncbi:MAG: FUSC family protein [Acidobacteriaceae bacterium]|nr:FUSC family protein [Acidobacteriaceae bacterium]